MTDEAKRIVTDLRVCADGGDCDRCSRNSPEPSSTCYWETIIDAADMIERLSAELEAAKRDFVRRGENT